ncbi:MAG: DUF3078 domain-containing protein [Ignavibacteriales bacterium]|nr:DUF3078 domain-containing protein [Ignavibacteriales bacterium]
MKYLFFTIVFFNFIFLKNSFSQNDSTTKASEWKHSVVSGITLTQVSFSDWAQGGENALAWTLSLEGKSELERAKFNWVNTYKFAYGQTKLGGGDLKKTDDKIDLSSVITMKYGTYINPYFGLTFKSQLDEGVKYDGTGKKTVVSKFFDPAYVTQSAGVGYQPIAQIKTRLGAALRETFSPNYGYADDAKTITEIEKSKVEGGMESVTDIEWKIEENILLTSKLELFAPFKTFDEVVFRGDNTLAMKVSKYITTNLNVQFINEKKITPRTQFKETLSLGISYTFI